MALFVAGVWSAPNVYVARWTGAARWVVDYRLYAPEGPDGDGKTKPAHVADMLAAVLDPDPASPAGRVAHHPVHADYLDAAALARLPVADLQVEAAPLEEVLHALS